MEDLKITKKLGPGIEYDEAKLGCHELTPSVLVDELNFYNNGRGWHDRADWTAVQTSQRIHFVTWSEAERSATDPLDVRVMDILSPSKNRFFLLHEDARALVLSWKMAQRLNLIESKIKQIVTEEYDNICWMDLYKELATFVGIQFDPKMLPRERMLKNCERFVDSLLSDTEYHPDDSGTAVESSGATGTRRLLENINFESFQQAHRAVSKNLGWVGPNRSGPVLEYITEEVSRQGHDVTVADGMIRIDWMWDSWQWAKTMRNRLEYRVPKIDHIRELGRRVERDKNAEGFRTCGVRVGMRTCCPPEEVIGRLEKLWERIEFIRPGKELAFPNPAPGPPFSGIISPIEFYKAFELIHPFRDGNGRVGKILLNWLNDTLDEPIFPPANLWGDPIRNP